MASPPKPWERGATTTTAPAINPGTSASSTAAVAGSTANSTPATAAPTRPPALTNAPATNVYNNQSSYASPYSSYGSNYNRMGTAYSPYGNSFAGYGGGYGGMGYGGMGYGGYGMNGMGYGMNGMNGMYGGGYGMNGMPMDPNNLSLSQHLEATTQQTFTLLHSIVQTFSGLAQMLESTFMATHSSFFAMVGVVEQFSHLRNALGSVLGLFGLVRWMKELLTGTRSSTPMQNEFKAFVNGQPVQAPSGQAAQIPKPSKKPLIVFLLAIFGVPYAMHRLIKILSQRAQQQAPNSVIQSAPFDPSTLAFARAKYAFNAASPVELSLAENDIVAVMGKLDPSTGMEVDPRAEVETDWWKGRTRDGREGWFPSKWVEVLERKKIQAVAAETAPVPVKKMD